MQNDDKRATRDDEPLSGETEADGAPDDAMEPEAPIEAQGPSLEDEFAEFAPPAPKAGRSHIELEPNFGMPDFDFPDDIRTGASDLSAEEENSAIMAAKETLDADKDTADMPLREGTGWDSVQSIERPVSLRGRIKRDTSADRNISLGGSLGASLGNSLGGGDPAPSPAPVSASAANVMPFPGAGFPRSSEPTPVDMLRGAGAPPAETADFAAPVDDRTEPAPDFDAVAQDTLADAVQSALRNVYGGHAAERLEEIAPEPGGMTVADSLMHAAGGNRERAADPLWPETGGKWQQDANEDYLENDRESAAAEANTDAVLDYLYGQRRSSGGGSVREQTVLSGESSLRDLGEAAGYRPDWQDGPDFDDRSPAQHSLRELGGAYRGGGSRFPEENDRSYMREPEMPYRGNVPPSRAEPDWQPPFVGGHPTAHVAAGSAYPAGGAAYPAHLPSAAPPETLSGGSPDSGHLLGAAGLGLIGGIALAGVLAVFVFNSFVPEEGDPSLADASPKFVERLTAPAPEQVPVTRIETPPARTAAAPAPEVAPEPEEPAAPVEAEPEIAQPEVPGQKIYARAASGSAEQPIPLDIEIADASDKEDSLISLKGLPSDAKLSTGIDVGGGQWLLPPARLADLTVTVAPGTSGSYNLEVQLLKDDAQTSLSDPIGFILNVGAERAAAEEPTNTTASPEQNARLAVLPDETPQIETDFLTQMLIRDGNRLMREGDIASARRLYEQAATNGNPEAALAMGRSFDPSYFEKLPVKTGKPDPATAFEWYKKALEGGLVTARVKIDALKQWLQR